LSIAGRHALRVPAREKRPPRLDLSPSSDISAAPAVNALAGNPL
jgi:hypothetical protein